MILSPSQRDALYEAILIRLTGVDSLLLAVEAGEFDKATTLSKEFSDYLRVVHDDLHWGESPVTDINPVAPPEVWMGVLSALRGRAVDAAAEVAGELSELSNQQARILEVRDHCDKLLEQQ
jgi:hypothetical protein